MKPTTWKIRDQMPDGSWSPEREIMLPQYRAELERAKVKAMAIFSANVAAARAKGEIQ